MKGVSLEEVKGFYEDAEKYRRSWLQVAKRSWDEIKSQGPGGRAFAFGVGSKTKKKYPAWYSIFKIRQPLLLSRIGIPIGKDTTEAGNDGVAATAALLKERLAKNLVKTFDFFDVLCAARDDFLATNFGLVRGYYERDEVKERVKDRLQITNTPEGIQQFINSQGEVILDDEILEDDEGFFIFTDQVVDVENERVCLEPVLYEHVRIDPQCRRWNRMRRISFDLFFSKPEFIEIFGRAAYNKLAVAAKAKDEEGWAKTQTIKVVEYWDDYTKETKWWPENGDDFIVPNGYYLPEEVEEGEAYELATMNGIYNLHKFFPTPPPLMMNAPTDHFWPVPEFHQLNDLIDDIHTLFARMMATTRAIRARLLYDANVDGLQEALHEGTDGDAFGVPNLAQALSGVGGSLDAVTQYINIQPLVEALGSMYTALDQRLNTLYRLTGTSDLLQGLEADKQRDRTLGEAQMLEKYATNQLAEPQRKMQEFVRDCYELLTEMAIKNFNDASLDKYFIPSTLPEEHQSRYRAAIGLLKSESKRFRIELETDSTIAINENYDKAMRAELVSIVTESLERVANIAQGNPALVAINLQALKYLVQGQRQGKMFQNEITTAIDAVIKQAEEAAQNAEPQFDKDQAEIAFKNQELQVTAQQTAQKLDADAQLKLAQIQSAERIESARLQQTAVLEQMKMQQEAALAGVTNQLEQFKIEVEHGKNSAEIQLKYEQIKGQISSDLQELALKRDQLMADVQVASGKLGLDKFKADLDAQVAGFEAMLKKQQQDLEAQRSMLDEREKWITEMRLQDEHRMATREAGMEQALRLHDAKLKEIELQRKIAETAMKPAKEEKKPEAPKKPKKSKKRLKVERDADGNILTLEAEDLDE